eukprot:TRINITY_DN180_c0_g1_i4.p1 TRINITY_DN180_c0_g1~~TRINITY_DN180_c0_g1_i4.p1  ORF type:complete len:277 (-),score=78.24 TRINITY_DN180_c0_g1_i4:72-902(-)
MLMSSFTQSAKEIEVVFGFDTTGSMYNVLAPLRKNLAKMMTELIQNVPGIRIGVMAVGDYGDSQSTYVTTWLDLTNDVAALVKWVNDVKATGGDDAPEAYELLLKDAQTLSWRSPNRALVLIGDSPPHPPSFTTEHIYWRAELNKLISMSVKVYGVLAIADKNSESAVFYRELAERSGGVFLLMKQMSLITDMFMAVCYKESSAEGLEKFQQQVAARDGGKVDTERAAMFAELKSETPKKANKETYNYIWWNDDSTSKTKPKFSYDKASNKWSHHR